MSRDSRGLSSAEGGPSARRVRRLKWAAKLPTTGYLLPAEVPRRRGRRGARETPEGPPSPCQKWIELGPVPGGRARACAVWSCRGGAADLAGPLLIGAVAGQDLPCGGDLESHTGWAAGRGLEEHNSSVPAGGGDDEGPIPGAKV
ncbi:hypothetical protein NDU88_002469 [Pleurodeles waltl]|uniref:Uncharacterized protein n=1 Tax=Pleurodeles waltl TaxID=8319 RepID=A0AAV7W3D9_PLEWA|nr:hypothetical protein NDU88_002469 [Pleurodeles waltl]